MMSKVKNLPLIAAALALGLPVAMPSVANAQAGGNPYVHAMELRDGENAGRVRRDEDGRDRPGQDYYPGAEHVQLVQLANNEILMFGMGSYDLNGAPVNNRVQMFCASVKMDPIVGPQLQYMGYVTNNDGDRYRNAHTPRATGIFADASGRPTVAAVTYNYAPNNHAYGYQLVFGPGCEQLSERTRIIAKNNDNCANHGESSEFVYYQDASTTKLASAHGCNGNGSDDSWMVLSEVTKNGDGTYTVDLITDDIRTEREEERTRPDIIPTGIADTAVVCLTAGNTQPPNRGVYCSAYDTNTGEQLWREAVARREDGIYRTQIRANPILDAAGKPTDTAYVTWRELKPRQGRDGKGSTQMMGTAIKFSRTGMDMLAVPSKNIFPGGDSSHPSQCTTLWGTDGVDVTSKLFMLSGSLNGNPAALSTGHLVDWNQYTRTMAPIRKVGLNTAIDTGWLSNLYGQNPNTQGRNFVKCIGNVMNPGYGVTGGYQPEVKSFVAIAATSRKYREGSTIAQDKLATDLVLVPAVIAPEAPPVGEPEEPQSEDPGDEDPQPDPGDEPDPEPEPQMPGSLGGCSVSSNGAGAGSLALLGLALVFVTRRRRR